jgi:hypothetical protein
MVMAVFDNVGELGRDPGYRGCPFVNAAAEYPDPAHPVRQAIAEHRRWFRDLLRNLLVADGHPDAERTADLLVALRIASGRQGRGGGCYVAAWNPARSLVPSPANAACSASSIASPPGGVRIASRSPRSTSSTSKEKKGQHLDSSTTNARAS